ncbi:MAG TPA: riboflavin synthase [Armatimonadota bacterium]|nr:riboflavin synthase [Armatimonadota bacterium]
MFTGLIEEKGKVIRAEPGPGGMRLTVEAPEVSRDVKLGDSVAVNGACLTAVEVSRPMLTFDIVRETVERSTLGRLRPGDAVNLERPLRAGDRLGGHMVLGHVDGIGAVREIRKSGGEMIFRFEAPVEIMKYVVQKGSLAVDGISLTVAELGPDWFSVAVIPHTLVSTTLGDAAAGSTVNLETDIIGKYVFKFVDRAAAASDKRFLDKLSEGGFME